ncbi:MAG: hypothetical protein M1274_00830 [Actinobacteria bacterium]|nr:hypothetical protein [Actinomycetota bacterium]
MQAKVTQDQFGTHIDWELDAVTPDRKSRMIDWFWSNMEKGMLLWHPNDHEPLEWYIPPKHGNPIGSVHIAPQTWSDGSRQNLYIRMEDPRTAPDGVTGLIVYAHCLVAGGYDQETIDRGQPFSYRLHQWESTDAGVKGKSSAIGGSRMSTPEEDLVWTDHGIEEIGNWGVFLPQLYALYRVVTNTKYNPFADLSVERQGAVVRYAHIP